MKSLLRSFISFLAFAIALATTWQPTALAQVSSYPYSYSWTGATSILGDGNWRTSGTGPGQAVQWTFVPSGGVSNSACAAVAGFKNSGKESYLDLLLDLTGRTLNGDETYTFFVKVAVVPASGVGTLRVQGGSGGTFVDLQPPTDLSGLSSTSFIPYSVLLSTTMSNKSNAALRIVVEALSNEPTPIVIVDDHSVSGSALPIQLASFNANVIRGNDVEVAWRTVSETNNYGFEVYRKRGEAGDWAKLGFVEGRGTTLTPQSYSYVDRPMSFGKYYYRIAQIDLDGKSNLLPEMAVNVGVGLDKFVLAQNYPNPFNPSTVIEFAVPQTGLATVKVYNILGQEVATLFMGNADAGKVYTTQFNPTSLPSGLYFYTLRSAGKVETRRMILLK